MLSLLIEVLYRYVIYYFIIINFRMERNTTQIN